MTIEQAYRKIRAYFSAPGADFGYDVSSASCVYRTEDGRKCAVGCLIPDTKYDPRFEGEGLLELLHDGLGFLLPNENVERFEEFLLAAQRTHDRRAEGRTYTEEGFPIWVEELSGHMRKIESSIPAFLRDLDALAREYEVAV